MQRQRTATKPPTIKYADLPLDLLANISWSLTWRENRKLHVANKGCLTTGYQFLSRIVVTEKDQKKEPKLTDSAGESVEHRGLAALAALKFSELPSVQQVKISAESAKLDSIAAKLKDLRQLKKVSLRGGSQSLRNPISLPASLKVFKFHDYTCWNDLFSTVGALPKLEKLVFGPEITISDITKIHNLKNLKLLHLSRIRDLDATKLDKILPLVKSLPAAVLTHKKGLELGTFDSRTLFTEAEVTLDYLRAFVALGLLPNPLETARRIVGSGWYERKPKRAASSHQSVAYLDPNEIPKLYLQERWVPLTEIQPDLHRLLAIVQSQQQFDNFADQIFLPLNSTMDSPLSPKEDTAEARTTFLLTTEGHSSLVFASDFFITQLFKHPDRLHFRFKDVKIENAPLHWFAVNAKMEKLFVDHGIPVDSSPQRLNTLMKVWKHVNDYRWRGGPETAFDPKFVFDMFWNNRDYFEKNVKAILVTAAESLDAKGLAHITKSMLAKDFESPDNHVLVEEFFFDIPGIVAEALVKYIGANHREIEAKLVRKAVSLGVPALYRALDAKDPHVEEYYVFEGVQNSLHVLLSGNTSHPAQFREMVELVKSKVPKDSTLLRAPDSKGNYPIHEWIQLLFQCGTAGRVEAVKELIVTYAGGSASVVDSKQTTVPTLLKQLLKKASPQVRKALKTVTEEIRKATSGKP